MLKRIDNDFDLDSLANLYILDLNCEHIPASLHNYILSNAEKLIEDFFKEEDLSFNFKIFVNVERIMILFTDLPQAIKQDNLEVKGPKLDVIEKAGKQILDKFCEKIKRENDGASVEIFEKENYYYAKVILEDKSIEYYLSNFTEYFLEKMPWPKKMRWFAESKFGWIRPIRNIVSLFNDKKIPLDEKFDFIPQNVDINDVQEYLKNIDIESFDLDKKIKQMKEYCEKFSKADYEECMLEEVCANSKRVYPFDCYVFQKERNILENLPNEFIKECVVSNQQAVVIYDDKRKNLFGQDLISHFVLASSKEPTEYMKRDIAKVIESRLLDLKFFFEADKNLKDLDFLKDKRKDSLIYAGLGTLDKKILRMKDYLKELKGFEILNEVLEVYQIDLYTKTIQEYPGLINKAFFYIYDFLPENIRRIIYKSGEDEAESMIDGNSDEVSKNALMLRFIYNLDMLIGFFSISIMPSSTQDPLGFKKICSQTIEIGLKIQEKGFAKLADISNIIKFAFERIKEKIDVKNNNVCNDLYTFFIGRMFYYLYKKYHHQLNKIGMKADVVLADRSSDLKPTLLLDNIDNNTFWNTENKLKAILSLSPEELELLVNTDKRVKNFLKNKQIKDCAKLDDLSNRMMDIIQVKNIDLKGLIAVSQELQIIFDDNMILDPEFTDSRLFALKKISDLFSEFGNFHR